MYFTLEVSYWLTLLLSIPTAGFLVRAFIIMHDCGHGRFYPPGDGTMSSGLSPGCSR